MKKRIGEILIEMGFIDNDQLEMGLDESKKTGFMLGEVLLRLDWITDEQLQMAIAVQSGAHILNTKTVKPDPDLIKQIPYEFVSHYAVFPFSLEDGTIKMATSNPFDVIVKDELTRMTGHRVASYVAPKDWILQAIGFHYKTAVALDSAVESITSSVGTETKFEDDQIVRLADLVIEKGYILGSSDIHIVADVNLTRVYYRIDGVLHQKFLFQKKFHAGLVSRFKIMGDMDISNPNIPHDGRFRYEGNIGEIYVRVSTFPTQLGETVVLRLLIYSEVLGDLQKLGFEDEDLEVFLRNIRRPYGLILATGPTGSGKTTSLYSALMNISNPGINVMTIEDPIEYVIPTIRQTAVNPKAGLTFANALRAAMRQDPDVILVGEIRDQETAELAMRASITGHLVLSTLHTNDAASAINRLLDLGVSKSMLASSLTLVSAQRLLRRVCPRCASEVVPTPEQSEIFVRNELDPPAKMAKAEGCDVCSNAGYKGRLGVYEIIQVDRNMEELIFSGAIRSMIEEAAVKAGTSLLLKQGLKQVLYQATSLDEVLRVIADA
jgi:type IV pilus assembly protein PilB